MKELLISMTNEEFEQIIQATGIVQAKIHYKQLRNDKERNENYDNK